MHPLPCGMHPLPCGMHPLALAGRNVADVNFFFASLRACGLQGRTEVGVLHLILLVKIFGNHFTCR